MTKKKKKKKHMNRKVIARSFGEAVATGASAGALTMLAGQSERIFLNGQLWDRRVVNAAVASIASWLAGMMGPVFHSIDKNGIVPFPQEILVGLTGLLLSYFGTEGDAAVRDAMTALKGFGVFAGAEAIGQYLVDTVLAKVVGVRMFK
jgi:hypothetical protein